MDTSFSLRIDGNVRQWGGNNSPQGDRHNRRRQKLQVLLQALKAGELDAAPLAFTALINFNPSISGNPCLKNWFCTSKQQFICSATLWLGITKSWLAVAIQ